MTVMKRWLAVIAMVGLAAGAAYGSIVINNATSYAYGQNFDTLAASGTGNPWTDNSTIAGWWWDSNNSARNPDSYGYIGDAGTNATGAGHSYGTTSERAMGALSSTGTDILFGVQFVNSSGSAIPLSNILISYVGEQWRQNSNAQTLAFSYAIDSSAIANTLDGSATWVANTSLDFVSPNTGTAGALDGNDAANRATFTNVPLAGSGSLNNGEYLMLRWKKTGTNSHGLAVDDFQLRVIPEPATFGLVAAFGGLLMLRRRLRK